MKNKRGYVMLISVLVFTVVGGVIALATMTMGIMSVQNNDALIFSAKSRSLANACGELALQEIKDSVLYTGTTVENIGDGTCQYTVSIDGLGRDIDVEAHVNEYYSRLDIQVDQVTPTINVSSWQEVN